MNSWIDVIDDAIKIGFGSSLTLIGILIANRYQTRKELRNRRWDVIQKSTIEFESSAQVFNRLQAHYLRYRENANRVDRHSREDEFLNNLSILSVECGHAIQSMQGLESMLVVLSAEASSARIRNFRNCAVALQNQALPVEDGIASVESFEKLWQACLGAKQEALNALKEDYRSS